MANHFGYSKVMQLTVKKTRHRVVFSHGISAGGLIEMLSNVPATAVVDECYHDGDTSEIVTIEFLEEVSVDR